MQYFKQNDIEIDRQIAWLWGRFKNTIHFMNINKNT